MSGYIAITETHGLNAFYVGERRVEDDEQIVLRRDVGKQPIHLGTLKEIKDRNVEGQTSQIIGYNNDNYGPPKDCLGHLFVLMIIILMYFRKWFGVSMLTRLTLT